MIGIPEAQTKEFKEDVKDVIVYIVILFIRSNEALIKLINAKNFNYATMKTSLKNYENISFDENKLVEELQKDPAIKSKVEKILYQIASGMARNIIQFMESPQKLFPKNVYLFYESPRLWLLTILNKASIEIKEYLGILDELYLHQLIENKNTILFCENCFLENRSYEEYHGKIAPSKITKGKCLNCGKPLSYSAIFSLDELLKDAIFSKDGFLSVYFGWLLKEEGISFTFGEYSSEYENDFIVNNDTLVECKMFKLGKDKIAIRSELENGFTQIKKHIESLNKDKKEIRYAYLIWNRFEYPEELIEKVKKKYKDLFEKYSFEVVGPEDIEGLISELKERGEI